MEIQIQTFQEESMRLKMIIDHLLKEKTSALMNHDERGKLEEEFYLQANHVKLLKKDNEEMATAIKILEEQNFEYEKKLSEQDKKLRRDNAHSKKVVNEKEKEINRLKNEVFGSPGGSLAKADKNKRPMTSQENVGKTQDLEKKQMENLSLINQLAHKEQSILQLERQIRDMKIEFNEKLNTAQNEKQNLLREVEKASNQKGEARNQEKPKETGILINSVAVKDSNKGNTKSNFSEDRPAMELRIDVKNTKVADMKPVEEKKSARRRLPKVMLSDVQDLGLELNMRLKIKKTGYTEAEKMCFDRVKGATINIKEMKEIVSNEPFCVRNPDQIEVLSRYLIENNNEEYIFYDEDCKNDTTIVKSVIKKLIGPVNLIEESASKKIFEDLVTIFNKFRQSIKEATLMHNKSGFVTRKDLQDVSRYLELDFSAAQVDFMMLKMFEYADDVHKLSLDKLLEIFTDKPQKEGSRKTTMVKQQSQPQPEPEQKKFELKLEPTVSKKDPIAEARPDQKNSALSGNVPLKSEDKKTDLKPDLKSSSSKTDIVVPVKVPSNEINSGTKQPVSLADSNVKNGGESPVKKGAESPVKQGGESPVKKGAESPVKKGGESLGVSEITPARRLIPQTSGEYPEIVDSSPGTKKHSTILSKQEEEEFDDFDDEEFNRKLSHKDKMNHGVNPTKKSANKTPNNKPFSSQNSGTKSPDRMKTDDTYETQVSQNSDGFFGSEEKKEESKSMKPTITDEKLKGKKYEPIPIGELNEEEENKESKMDDKIKLNYDEDEDDGYNYAESEEEQGW
jgi:hypothetical protein